jgi:hypothetical protein
MCLHVAEHMLSLACLAALLSRAGTVSAPEAQETVSHSSLLLGLAGMPQCKAVAPGREPRSSHSGAFASTLLNQCLIKADKYKPYLSISEADI